MAAPCNASLAPEGRSVEFLGGDTAGEAAKLAGAGGSTFMPMI
jgi:hypothetical protein